MKTLLLILLLSTSLISASYASSGLGSSASHEKTFGSDMNLDGQVTISDLGLWFDFVLDSALINPSNEAVAFIQGTGLGGFFEVSSDGFVYLVAIVFLISIKVLIFIILPIMLVSFILSWAGERLKKAPEKFSNFKSENWKFQSGFLGVFFFILFFIAQYFDFNVDSFIFFWISIVFLLIYYIRKKL